MSEEDFTIESLAAYMHLSGAQVLRLADRGKVPGRKIAGVWRFSAPEIHHWLEARIGLSDDDELAEMETMLERAGGGEQSPKLSIVDMLPASAMAIPLNARTRSSVITAMVDTAAATGWLWDPAKMADAVRVRETMQPTALEGGVALLHPRRPMPAILGQAFLAFGRTERGIPFGGSRGALTDLFFLICSVEDQGHLRVLARLSRLIGDAALLVTLRSAPDAATARRLIAEAEENLSG